LQEAAGNFIVSSHLEDDDDMGAFWRDVKQARQEKRASNRDNAPEVLTQAGLKFEAKNGGAHLIVTGLDRQVVDFWPGTGLWIARKTRREGRGVFNLIRALQPS
jgi:hypothetical protein